jgi:hypothetical protein
MHVFLLMLLLLAITPAWAAWEEIANRDGRALFIDPETIRKDGSLRRVWTMCNYAAPNADGALSTKSLMEYDCVDGRYRILTISTHAECMGEGETLHTEAASHPWWRDSPPGTVAAKILVQVCAK